MRPSRPRSRREHVQEIDRAARRAGDSRRAAGDAPIRLSVRSPWPTPCGSRRRTTFATSRRQTRSARRATLFGGARGHVPDAHRQRRSEQAARATASTPRRNTLIRLRPGVVIQHRPERRRSRCSTPARRSPTSGPQQANVVGAASDAGQHRVRCLRSHVKQAVQRHPRRRKNLKARHGRSSRPLTQQLQTSIAKVNAGAANVSDSLRSVVQVGNAQLAMLTAQNSFAHGRARRSRGSSARHTSSRPMLADTVDHAVAPIDSAMIMRLALVGSDDPSVRGAVVRGASFGASAKAGVSPDGDGKPELLGERARRAVYGLNGNPYPVHSRHSSQHQLSDLQPVHARERGRHGADQLRKRAGAGEGRAPRRAAERHHADRDDPQRRRDNADSADQRSRERGRPPRAAAALQARRRRRCSTCSPRSRRSSRRGSS